MCVTFFRISTTKKIKFVIGFNRDEDIERKAENLQYLTPNIVCGVDVETGTSWLAFNKLTGNFAALTNYRQPPNPENAKKKFSSRGHLILEFVKIGDGGKFETI